MTTTRIWPVVAVALCLVGAWTAIRLEMRNQLLSRRLEDALSAEQAAHAAADSAEAAFGAAIDSAQAAHARAVEGMRRLEDALRGSSEDLEHARAQLDVAIGRTADSTVIRTAVLHERMATDSVVAIQSREIEILRSQVDFWRRTALVGREALASRDRELETVQRRIDVMVAEHRARERKWKFIGYGAAAVSLAVVVLGAT